MTNLTQETRAVRALLREAVERGIATGCIRGDLPAARVAQLLMSVGISAVHAAVSGADTEADTTGGFPDDVWQLCLGGIGSRVPVSSPA